MHVVTHSMIELNILENWKLGNQPTRVKKQLLSVNLFFLFNLVEFSLYKFVERRRRQFTFYPFGFHLSTNSGCGNLEESEHGKLIVFTPVEVFKPSL